jgi:hypothetical protein
MSVSSKNTPEVSLYLDLLKRDPVKQILKGAIRGFAVGYGIQATWKVILGVLFGRVFRKPELLKDYLGRDSVSFGLFLGSFNSLFRAVYYLLSVLHRDRNKNEGMKIFVAGTVAGVSMLLDRKDRWSDIGMYMFARACAALASRLYEKNIWGIQDSNNMLLILIRNHLDTFVFCVCCCIIMTTFIYRPDFFPRGYYKLFQSVEGSDRVITADWRRRFRRYYHTFFRTEEERIKEEERLRRRAVEKEKEHAQKEK